MEASGKKPQTPLFLQRSHEILPFTGSIKSSQLTRLLVELKAEGPCITDSANSCHSQLLAG